MSRLRIAIAQSDSDLLKNEILSKKSAAPTDRRQMVKIPWDAVRVEDLEMNKSFTFGSTFYTSFLTADSTVKSVEEEEPKPSVPVNLLPEWFEEKDSLTVSKLESSESPVPVEAGGDAPLEKNNDHQ